jgi:futalosine hydrolase
MRVVITAATAGEWMPALSNINALYTGGGNRLTVSFHQSGVGMLASAFSLTKLLLEEKPHLVIQAGIAGCFNTKTALGKVLVIGEEMLGDTGVLEGNKWRDVFDLELQKSGNPPFEKRRLPNQWLDTFNLLKLPAVTGITVNEITTSAERIKLLVKKYNPAIESMEGAALHYACRQTGTPFIQIRAVSNYIGERNKANWKIKEAIGNLNQALLKYTDKLYKIS